MFAYAVFEIACRTSAQDQQKRRSNNLLDRRCFCWSWAPVRQAISNKATVYAGLKDQQQSVPKTIELNGHQMAIWASGKH